MPTLNVRALCLPTVREHLSTSPGILEPSPTAFLAADRLDAERLAGPAAPGFVRLSLGYQRDGYVDAATPVIATPRGEFFRVARRAELLAGPTLKRGIEDAAHLRVFEAFAERITRLACAASVNPAAARRLAHAVAQAVGRLGLYPALAAYPDKDTEIGIAAAVYALGSRASIEVHLAQVPAAPGGNA